MNIVVVGSGARENAITWSLSRDAKHRVWTLPGNPSCPHAVDIATNNFDAIYDFCKQNQVELVIVGPEKPLVQGIVDELSAKGLKVFGPTKQAARLEASKIWSKQFMQRHQVQTAAFTITHTLEEARARIYELDGNCVIKWDGLAAGKGVCVTSNLQEAEQALQELHLQFSSADFVIEKKLQGREISIFIVTNGEQYCLLPPAQDYKRAHDANQGPNTGGMGAVSFSGLVSPELKNKILSKIIEPSLRGLREEKIPYSGFLFFGVMIEEEEPYLLEYNVRLGDPESSAVLPRLKTPLLDLIIASFEQGLDRLVCEVDPDPIINVVIASGGYPGPYQTGYAISGWDSLDEDSLVFHAGTSYNENPHSLIPKTNKIYSAGGRVLNVLAKGKTIEEARNKVYKNCAKLYFYNSYYRRDIGAEFLDKENCYTDLGTRI